MRNKRLQLVFAMLFISLFFATHTHAASDTSPRLANYFLNWTITDSDATALARWDLVVLDIENQYKNPNLIKKIRRLNPNITILAYITPQEIRKDAANGFSILRRKLDTNIDSSWYLKNAQGEKLSWWQGTYLLNVTNNAPVVQGKRFNQFLVDFMVDEVASTGLWDGIYYDNAWDSITYFAGNSIDINGDGRNDSGLDAAWKSGMQYIYNETKRRLPSMIIVGNGTTRAYRNELNGMMLENFIAPAWEPTMNTYKYNDETNDYNIINNNTGNNGGKTNYKDVRFGLGSTLLENGYYSYDFGDTDHGQLWWYDEYDVDLGTALGDATSEQNHTSYTRDVWQREFSNGLSIVNSTNERKLVELNGEFEKIHGTQDTAVNDGSIVEEVELDAEDGIILLKTFDSLDDVLFNNGTFARFYNGDGSRTRNGFFVFEDEYRGGDSIAHVDLDGNGKRDLLVVRGNKMTAWRDDGLLLLKSWPFGANYEGSLHVTIADIYRNGRKQVFVSADQGYPAPIKVYSKDGNILKDNWFPFGSKYTGGYDVAIADFGNDFGKHIAIGAGVGKSPVVELFNYAYEYERRWNAFETSFKGGISIAGGDVDNDGKDEIVVGAGPGKDPIIRVFDQMGNLEKEFTAYSSFSKPGIQVETLDVDFNGVEDIVGFSDGPGL